MDLLKVSGVSKKQEGVFVLQNVSFTQERFKKIAVAGETGSGKSTLLKVVAGLVQPDEGEVTFESTRVLGPDEKLLPGHPGIAYLSQHFELRNNYRVEEVLDYANKLSNEEAGAIYHVCQIDHLLNRKTDQVSGGEKQRIAIARLLISCPSLLLLDEPYSNLDIIHKNILKSVIRDIGEKLKITCTLISHDPSDTLSWADEIIVMKDGQIVQQATPQQIYTRPVNEYTAGLFGKYNLIRPHFLSALLETDGIVMNGKGAFVRPENLKIALEENAAPKGIVTEVIFLGSSYDIEVTFPQEVVTVRTTEANIAKGDAVSVSLPSTDLWYL